MIAPDDDPDPLDGPTTSAPGQGVEPVEGGSGLPGPVMDGLGQGSVVDPDMNASPTEDASGQGPVAEGETGDDTGIFSQGEVFQSAELSSWFHSDQYGHGEGFQLDAFLADAPLDYLEALLELQTLDIVRPDAPVAYYYIMKGGQDCNDNGVPDKLDIEEGTSLDLNADGVPDVCENDGFGGTDDLTPSKHTDEPSDEHDGNDPGTEDHGADDGRFTKLEGTSDTDSSVENKTNTAQGPSSPCGTGAGLPVVMLSLGWMFVATGRIGLSCMTASTTGLRKRRIQKNDM